MNRFGAFLIHLAISLAIFAVLAWLVVYVWYPDFFFASDGGWQGIRIIVLVDLVLGPLLTLVVFNRNKPRAELRRDLSIIATFQTVCLAAGTWVVYSERPLALVYVDGQFYSMSAEDYREVDVEVPSLDAIPGPYPKRVLVELPEDLERQSTVREGAFASGRPLRTLTELYRPLTYGRLNLEREQVDSATLRRNAPVEVDHWLAEHGGRLDDYAFFPFAARYGYVFLAMARERQEIIGLLNVSRLRQRADSTGQAAG